MDPQRPVRQPSRLVLVGLDFAVTGICLSVALYFVRQTSSARHWTSVLLANIVLSLPLLVGAVLLFAFLELYEPAALTSELRGLVLGLVVAGGAALGTDRLFGSLQQNATLEPTTIVVAVLLAVALVPASRVLGRAARRAVAARSGEIW